MSGSSTSPVPSAPAPSAPPAPGGSSVTPPQGRELEVKVIEWKGPMPSDEVYCTTALNHRHATLGKGRKTDIGASWGDDAAVRLLLDDEMPVEDHVLELSVVQGQTLGDTLLAKSTSRVGEFAGVSEGGQRVFFPVLSEGGRLIGTLKLQLCLHSQGASFAPCPAPSAPPMTALQDLQPQQLPSNPYAASLPSHPPGPQCRIVQNKGGPLRFTGNPPFPPPPISTKTPTELWEEYVAKCGTEKQKSETAWETKRRETATKHKGEGFLGKLKSGASSVLHHTGAFVKDAALSAEVAVRKADVDSDNKLWTANFPALAPQDPLEAAYKCHFVEGEGRIVEGTVFVATRTFAFLPAPHDKKKPTEQPPFFEELRNVITYQRAQSLGHSCIQIYTSSGYVYQFGHFPTDLKRQVGAMWGTVHSSPFESFLNYFDHQWRRNTQVPVPGVPYMQ